MKKVHVSMCMAGILLCSLSSCASTKQATILADLSGEWDIIEINDAAVIPSPGQVFPFIGFDTETGKVYGNSGCNRLMGAFDMQAKPGTIDLGALGSTRMMCPDMTVENNVLATLARVRRYRKLDAGNVALYGSSDRCPIAVLKKKTQAVALLIGLLHGRWVIAEAQGVAIPADMENRPFLEFDVADKKVHGHAGCNIINGVFLAKDNNAASISFSDFITTLTACPDMEVEKSVNRALAQTKTFGKLAGGGIGFYDANDALVMVLERACD